MLHRVLASLLCLLGAAALALGIASATAWRADDVLVADAVAPDGTTMVVTAPGVLDLAADEVTVTATVPRGDVVIALGRTADVEAWVGTDAHLVVTGLAEWHVLATDAVAQSEPEPDPSAAPTDAPTDQATEEATETPAAEETAAATEDGSDAADGESDGAADEAVAPDPSGSDLWVTEERGSGEATLEWTREDGRWSVLVAATEPGVRPTVALAWPQVVTTPWLVPGVVGGGLLLLIGLAWWVFLLVGARRRRRVRPDVAAPTEPAAVGATARPAAGTPASAPAGYPGGVPAAAPVGAVPGGGTGADAAVPMTRRRLRELEEERQRAEAASRFPTRIAGPQRAGSRRARPDGAEASTPTPPPGTSAPSRPGRLFGRRAPEPATVVEPEAPPAPAAAPSPEQRATPAASADAWRRAWGLGAAPLAPTDQPQQDDRPDGGPR